MTTYSRRPLKHSLVRALRRVPDFAALEDRILLKVVGASVNLFWPAGSSVFEKGSPSEALYIVLVGRIRIMDGQGSEDTVGHIEAGDYFGELSLMRRSEHTKTARALDDSEILVLPKRSFEALLEVDEDLAALMRSKRASTVEELQRS